MQRIKIIIASLTLLVSFSVPGLAAAQAPAPTLIVAATGQADACNGLDQLGGTSCGNGGAGQNQIAKVSTAVVNIISLIAGIAAVIMIVIAGVRFVTSGGESSAVSAAKNNLIYAIIGLVIVAVAQLIVHFVLNAIFNGSTQ